MCNELFRIFTGVGPAGEGKHYSGPGGITMRSSVSAIAEESANALILQSSFRNRSGKLHKR